MKRFRRIISSWLVLCMLLPMLPQTAWANEEKITDSGSCGEKLTWCFKESTGTLTISGIGDMEDYGSKMVNHPSYDYLWVTNAPWQDYYETIEKIVIESGVTSIGEMAFRGCINADSVSLSEDIISFGAYSFSDCDNLTNIKIPQSVKNIGDSALSDCSNLKEVTILGAKSIENFAFAECTLLHDVILPDTLTSIGAYSFRSCESLKEITIPGGVRSIGAFAFVWCDNLESIVFEGGAPDMEDSVLSGLNCTVNYPARDSSWSKDFIAQFDSSITWIPIGGSSSPELHEHSYTAVTTAPTCAEQGYTTYTCSCNDSYVSDYVDATGHSYGEWYETKTPTQEEEGEERRDCSGCSHYETHIVDKLSTTNDTTDLYSGTCGDDLTWRFEKETGTLIISGSGTMYSYSYSRKKPWADFVDSIISIIVESGVTNIGHNAFSDCINLTNITIPSGVTSIDGLAFSDCSSLTSITIPNGITSISSLAFDGCSSLASITIPDSITSIGSSAFRDCSSLTSITIPAGVTSIGDQAFSGCSSLTNVTIPDGVTSIDYNTFDGCSSLTSIIIPDSVTNIDHAAFAYCRSLTNITIPNGVTNIDSMVFLGCSSLTSMTIPNGVTNIGEKAFFNCASMKSVTIPESVTSISENAFGNCGALESITIPNGVTSINLDTFSACSSLTSIIIPDSVASIASFAFSGCSSLTNVTIPSGVASISRYTFSGCSRLTSITIPDSVTSIDEGAFWNCSSLVSIAIPDSVTSIGAAAFKECSSLASIVIPNNVNCISSRLFEDCSNLTNVEIPDSITSIGKYAFDGCNNLKKITIPVNVTSIGQYAFSDCNSLTSIIIPDGVTSIEDRTFSDCNSLENIIIPESVTNIGQYAFSDCSGLKNITISKNVTSIGNGAFYRCKSLTKIELPSGITSIGDRTFTCCNSFVSITIPAGVASIGKYAFGYCTRLRSVSIPSGVTSIGDYAFCEADSLKDIYFSGSKEEWEAVDIGYGNVWNWTDINIHYNSSGSGGNESGSDNDSEDDSGDSEKENHFGPNHRVDITGQLSFSPKELKIVIQNTKLTSDILSEKEKDALRIKNAELLITLPTGWTFSENNSRTNLLPIADIPLGQSVTIDLPVVTDGTGYKTVTAEYSENDEVIFTEKISIYLPDTPSVTITPGQNNEESDNQRAEEYILSAGTYETVKISSGKNYIVKDGTTVTADKIIVEGNLCVSGNLTAKTITIQGNGDLDVTGSVSVTNKMKLNGGNLFNSNFCRCDLLGTSSIAELVMDGSCTVKTAGTTTIGICKVKGGYFEQYNGNLIITDTLEVSGENSNHPACELNGGTLWLEGSLKQSWHSGNFQASGDHVTIKTNGWNEDSIQFAKNASDNVYFKHLYVDEAIAADIEAYDLTDFAIKYVMGDFCQATVDKNARTYKVIKNSNINSQEEFELQLQEALSPEITFAIKDDGRIKKALGDDGYEVFLRLVKSWVVCLQTDLVKETLKIDQISRDFSSAEIIIGDSHIIVYSDTFSNSTQKLSFLYWYGKIGDVVYSKDNCQSLGIGTISDKDAFVQGAKKYMVEKAIHQYEQMFVLSASAEINNLLNEIVKFCLSVYKFDKNAKKLADSASFNCDFLDSFEELPDIPSTYNASVSTVAHASVNNSIALSAGDYDMPEILTQAHSDTVATSTVIVSDGAQTEVPFTDPLLEQILRNALGKGTDDAIVSDDVQQITVLNLRGHQLYSLGGLEYFSNLKELYVSGNNLRSLQPISELTSLEILDVSENQIIELSPISELTRLKELSVANNLITDLTALSGLTALETLDLNNCPIENYNGLSQLTGLMELNISGNEIPDHNLSILSNLRSLTVLIANDCGLSSVSGLAGDALAQLYLQNNAISSLGNADFANLVFADFSGNSLEDVSALEGAKKLENLYISGNALDDSAATSLQNLVTLKTLDISANRITALSFLSGMVGLEKLDAHSNALSDISGLNGHTVLSVLILDSCDLTDAHTSQLTDSGAITHLQMRHNELTDCSFLEWMPALIYADLSYNQIDAATVPDDVQNLTDTTVAPITIRSIQLTADGNRLLAGNNIQINCYVYPVLADTTGIVWECDNTAVATISENGVVTGVSEGEVIITAAAENGVSAQIALSVIKECVHEYDGADFVWADCDACTAVVSCSKCAERQVLNCTISSVTSPATETANGTIVYTAAVELNGITYTDAQTVIIPAIDHEVHIPAPEWLFDESSHWQICSVCNEKMEESEHSAGAAATENTSQTCTVCACILQPPKNFSWFFGAIEESDDNYLWASGNYVKIMEKYGSRTNRK